MNRFKWGGVKEKKDYYADETVRRMIYTHRNLIANLAQTMYDNREPDIKVMNVLEKWYKEFPNGIIAYDALRDNSITIANVYRMLYLKQHYDKEDGLEPQLTEEQKKILEERIFEIAGAIVKEQFEYIKWYNTNIVNQNSITKLFISLITLKQLLTVRATQQHQSTPFV